MVLSQKKLPQNKAKRKLECNVADKDEEVARKMLKSKKPKISKEVEHVPPEVKKQKTNVSIKRKNKNKNVQETGKIVIEDNKRPEMKKLTKEAKSMKLNEKNDKTKNIEGELSKSHIKRCISAMFHLTEEQSKNKNNLIEGAHPIFLQVTCVRVPKVPRRQVRM